MTVQKINSRASLDRSPKSNWVEDSGGLPMYIKRIANHLHQEKGKTIGHSIAIAVNAAKKMCATGDLNWKGKQNVNPKSRAEACAAVASWERKKAGARVSKGDLGRKWTDDEYISHLTGETVIHKGCDCGKKFDPSDERVKADLRPKKKKGKIKKDFDPLQRRDTHTGKWKSKPKTKVWDKEKGEWVEKRFVSSDEREKLAGKGKAQPGGRFPIANEKDLKNAIRAIGRSKNPVATKKHIVRQARRLGKTNLLPQDWSVSKLDISDEEFETLSKSVDDFLNEPGIDTLEFSLDADIEKRDDEKQMVFGWASLAKDKDGNDVVDKQGDVLEDIDQMETVAYDFVLHSRDGGEMHVRKGVSTLVESFVSTPEKWEALGIPEGTLPTGWWVGFKVNDSDVWSKVKKGEYKMFSVHGSGMRKALE